MDNGWVKIHRKLLENPIFTNGNFLKIWLYLLLNAQHKPNKLLWNSKVVNLEPGQLLTGRKRIAKDTKVKETSVERCLQLLESLGQIGQQKTNKYRVITLLNWRYYQDKGQQTDNKRTTNGQQMDTYKNVKNDKNVKNKHTPSSQGDDLFERFWTAYPKKVGKGAALKAWKKTKPSQEMAARIIAAIIQQRGQERWQEEGGRFIPNPATWLNHGRWDDEVAEVAGAGRLSDFTSIKN